MADLISIQTADFDVASLHEALRADDASCGALVTFTGIVRELAGDEHLRGIFLEHYPAMTEKALRRIVLQARERWQLGEVILIHRIGELLANDNIVFVGVSSRHRAAAFEAACFIMDFLKRDAPFWKKELLSDDERWVEQKASDLDAAKRW
ncbi:molybdopterin guanine dinucleotide biosynthesis protein MoaE [Marinobacterium nitratireducens]|uniref:Molybdopterin synthase catalytic subunit n=1 Tax=Marinobacterium nitratireducens TaxID=518897 RepID=A0A917Z6W5_9GAMM|nr:molybdopterin synthase catalytic subunit MoaE [Marinobacterium nitratireducens]GGO76932.1 molybdopterin guanine dinucleotide biosynthesis protein MoaE [Marinobacterium nitratireducens]